MEKIRFRKIFIDQGIVFRESDKGWEEKNIYYETPINNYEITRKIQLPQAGAVSDNNFKTTTFHYCF